MNLIGFTILFVLSIIGVLLSAKFKKLSLIFVLILITTLIKFDNLNLYETFLKPINNFNTYSVLLFLVAFLFYYKDLIKQSHNLFLAVLAIFSVNSFIIFFVAYELFCNSIFVLNSAQPINKRSIQLHYLCSLIIGISFYKYIVSGSIFYITASYFVILSRLVYFLFLKNLNLETRFYSIVNLIVVSNLYYNNSYIFDKPNISIIFFVYLTMFIILSSYIFFKQKEFNNTYILNCYILVSAVLVIAKLGFYFLLFSFVALFVLLKVAEIMRGNYKPLHILLFIFSMFIYELEILKRLVHKMNFTFIAVLFVGIVLYKIKFFILLENFLDKHLYKRLIR